MPCRNAGPGSALPPFPRCIGTDRIASAKRIPHGSGLRESGSRRTFVTPFESFRPDGPGPSAVSGHPFGATVMLVDFLQSARRSAYPFPGPRPRRPKGRAAAERLEDRTLLSAVTFFQKFEGVDWTSTAAGGVGSEWNGGGSATLTVDGVQGEVVAAYLYWQGLDLLARVGDGIYDNETASFQGVAVTGVSLGTGGTGTWGVGSSQAFRADVTALVQAGLTTYSVAGLASKRGHSADGVSLVIVYQDGVRSNDRDLYVLDGNAVNSDEPWDVRLDGLDYRTGDVRAELHVADGQSSGEAGIRFSSPGSSTPGIDLADRSGRFDGSSVPNLGKSRAINGSLWDAHRFDVTAVFDGPATRSLSLTQGAGSIDSLSLVAMLVDTAARPANEPPVANDVALTVEEDGSVASRLDGHDPQGDSTLTFSLVSGPRAGSVTLDAATGGFTYHPPANFSGTVSFVYAATDGEFTASAAVTVTVTPVNDLPTWPAQSVTTAEDSAISGRLTASDVDGDVLSFLLLDGPAHGTLVLAADGSYVFTPDRDWNGNDVFRVAVSDGRSNPVAALVSVHVDPVNDPPVVDAAEFRVVASAPVGAVVGKVTASDVDGDPPAYSIVAGDVGGAFAIDPATGVVTVADRNALAAASGSAFTLTVEVSDGKGGTARAAVTVTVAPSLVVPIGVGLKGSKPVIDLDKSKWPPLVIYSTSTFDARNIDVDSLTLGRTGDERSLVVRRGGFRGYFYFDMNRDGRKDLVLLFFEVRATGLRPGDVALTLQGRLKDGTGFISTLPVAVTAKPVKAKGGKK